MTVSRARELRRRSTEAEKLLWRRLRNRHLDGVKFRRQESLGRYVVDFVTMEQQLIVEVDGGQHAAHSRADEMRTRWLASQDYRVIRFWNNEVLSNIDGVLQTILQALGR